jgi:hypothetical protein
LTVVFGVAVMVRAADVKPLERRWVRLGWVRHIVPAGDIVKRIRAGRTVVGVRMDAYSENDGLERYTGRYAYGWFTLFARCRLVAGCVWWLNCG